MSKEKKERKCLPKLTLTASILEALKSVVIKIG